MLQESREIDSLLLSRTTSINRWAESVFFRIFTFPRDLEFLVCLGLNFEEGRVNCKFL